MATQPKVITAKLSEQAHQYFDEVADSLEPGKDQVSASDDDVVNYVFEMLANLEKIIGDPAEFMEDIANNKLRIIPMIPNPKQQLKKSDQDE